MMGYLTDDVTDSLIDRLVREWHKPITPTPRAMAEMTDRRTLAEVLADEAADYDERRRRAH